jgi:hypothetical protein
MFGPINISCRLLTLYYFLPYLVFGIRDISDAILLTSPMIQYQVTREVTTNETISTLPYVF